MGLSAPILYATSAFDSTQAHNFQFNVIGGDQVVSNTLTIKNASTLATVYSQSQTTFSFLHSLPANTLTNGTRYQAFITTSNASSQTSVVSNTIQFYCYSTPTFSFTNIPTGNIINNASFQFNVQYDQSQSELLNSYVFNLYDAGDILIATSGTKYVTQSTLPLTLSYVFSGFADDSYYKIECLGITVNNTEITTGVVNITTQFDSPGGFTELELTNNCNGGYITIKSNAIAIEGVSNPSPPTYIENTKVDLTTENSWVAFDSGYQVINNFTARLWVSNITNGVNMLEMSSVYGDIIELYYEEDNTYAWCELYVKSNPVIWSYCLQSTKISKPVSGNTLCVYLRHINGYYTISIENLGVV